MKKLMENLFLLLCRNLPNKLARHLMFLLQSHPRLTDSWGVHVRAIHYYDPLPDFQRITPEQTRQTRARLAFDPNMAAQLELQRALSNTATEELKSLATSIPAPGFPFENGYFCKLDAAVYYALIRHLKPATVIEIGCGFSTRIADIALKRNRAEGLSGRLICIEPYPQARLTEFALEMELIQQPVQEVDLELFSNLKDNDILFIDSSHVAKFQSDVCHEFLNILPVLPSGCMCMTFSFPQIIMPNGWWKCALPSMSNTCWRHFSPSIASLRRNVHCTGYGSSTRKSCASAGRLKCCPTRTARVHQVFG